MRCVSCWATFALVGVLLLSWSSPGHAQELKPLVMILLDTSSSMEHAPGPDEVPPSCVPYGGSQDRDWCVSDGVTSYTRSRWTSAIEALTGRFDPDQYYCCAYERSVQERDADMPYHYGVPGPNGNFTGGVPQTQDGIMDDYREEVRFGLMTLDNHPHPNTGNAGFFSYGTGTGTFNSGAMARNSNRGNHGYATLGRGTGALQVIPQSDDPAEMAAGNDGLQHEVRWLFPYGYHSPIAPLIDDARHYLLNDSGLGLQGCYSERPKGVILVTDGLPDFDFCHENPGAPYELDGDGDNDDCTHFVFEGKTYTHPTELYQNSEAQAARLLAETGFPTYVIGFDAGPEADAKLRAIAHAGGTCPDPTAADCYYMADDTEQLRFAFEDVILRLLGEGQVRARTRPVTTSRTSFRATESGYYEVAAHFGGRLRFGEDSSRGLWRGQIERVTFKCDATGNMAIDSVIDFADTLAEQSSRTVLTASPGTPPGAAMPTLQVTCPSIPGCDDDVLAHITSHTLGDVYHSSPVTGLGPELDLPLSGYKQFRRDHGGRDTMLYVGTNDGQLRAFTLGDIDASGDVEGEERWAYVPRGVHTKLATVASSTGHVLTVDGTPIIKDVRLSRETVAGTPVETWATVLVGVLRGGGRSVFALDITDPDDPKFLWEHTASDVDADGSRPFARLGYTYGTPAVGNVVLATTDGGWREAAVAIVPGGVSSGSGDADEGQALYIIELATGQVLRTFTGLAGGEPMAELSSSAIGHSTVPGTLMSRAFVGDALGRLLRLDLAGADPAAWKLEVFFDPLAEGVLSAETPSPERAMLRPTLSRDRAGNLVVHYGAGDIGSLSPEATRSNFVASLTERIGFDPNGAVVASAELNWLLELDDGAKLSGSPVVFDNTAFFPTLHDGSDQDCPLPYARLWATHFTDTDTDTGALLSRVDLDADGQADLHTDFAPGTVVFGLDVTARPACYEEQLASGAYALKSPRPQTPQLVLQTGTDPYVGGTAPATTTTPVSPQEQIDKVRIDLPPPATSLRTTSWGAIYK